MALFGLFSSTPSDGQVITTSKEVEDIKSEIVALEATAKMLQKSHRKAIKRLAKAQQSHRKTALAHAAATCEN